ncbi:MAG: cupin-like domain-containing protein [Oceanicaulis sp.]|nr:cupin-like domain-containing protein [Oceanicaulis sp.]
MNLREVFNIRPEYRALMSALFAELREMHPRFRPDVIKGGLLISAPGARVPFHIDRTDTMLWHLRGRKRVYVYPRGAPVLSEADVEAVLMHPFSDDLPYESAFDKRAQVFDLEPGEVLCWPVHTPHRVTNLEGLNVSMATEYTCHDVRVRNHAMMFNGLIRRRLGLTPSIEDSRGAGLAARAGLGFTARKLKLLPRVPPPAAAPAAGALQHLQTEA